MDELLDLLPEEEAPAPEQEILEEKIISENIEPALTLDYKIKDTEGRA